MMSFLDDEQGRIIHFDPVSGRALVLPLPATDVGRAEDLLREDVSPWIPWSAPGAMPPQQQFLEARRSSDLVVGVLGAETCNFACRYCYEQHRPRLMTEETAARVLAFVRARLGEASRLHFGWFGGESLLNAGLVASLTREVREACERAGTHFVCGISTNGYLLVPEIAEQLREAGLQRLQITLDGLAQQHDERRPLGDGSPSFARIWENLLYLRSMAEPFAKVTIRCNVDHDNVQSVFALIRHLVETFGDCSNTFEIYARPVGDPGNGRAGPCFGTAEWRAMQAQFSAAAYTLAKESLPSPRPVYCEANLRNSFLIGANGEVYKCSHRMGDEDVIGHLERDGELVLNQRSEQWMVNYFDDRACMECSFLPLCQGGCPLQRLQGGKTCAWTEDSVRAQCIVASRMLLPEMDGPAIIG